MTCNSLRSIQTTGRISTAILLAATASGRCGIAQELPALPNSMLASLSAPMRPPSLFSSLGKPATRKLSPVSRQASSAHVLASLSRPSAGAHALNSAARHPGPTHASLASVSKSHNTTHPILAALKPHKADRDLLSHSKQPGLNHAFHLIPRQLSAPQEVASVTRPLIRAVPKEVATALDPAGSSFSMAATTGAEHTLHLTVGHLMFLTTKDRVRRIYIANPAVLDSYTVSPNQVVITAKTPGLSSVVVWDQSDRSQVYMVSSDINVDELRVSMKQAIPSDSVQVEGRESKVLLSGTVGTDALSDTAVKLASFYSKEVANSLIVNSASIKQVKLKVRIVEVDRSKLNQFGINIFNPIGNYLGGATTGQFPTTTDVTVTQGTNGAPSQKLTYSDPLNFLFYSFKYNLGVTIKDLENKQVLQILAEPTITTISGQKASFLAGGEFPFPVVQSSGSGTASVTVQFRPYGVKLDFTPQVNVDGTIALKVAPEVSALDFANAVTISGYTIPALSTKRADTQVVLRSGQSFAISGLLDRRTTDILSKTPGIASVPVLGQLFKSKGITTSTSELIVIITPTIVDPLNEMVDLDEPEPAVPFMRPETFDKSLPAAAKKP